jgi:hypothetical protein
LGGRKVEDGIKESWVRGVPEGNASGSVEELLGTGMEEVTLLLDIGIRLEGGYVKLG